MLEVTSGKITMGHEKWVRPMIDERMMRLPVREKIVDWHMTSLEGHLGNRDEGMNGTERWKKRNLQFLKKQ